MIRNRRKHAVIFLTLLLLSSGPAFVRGSELSISSCPGYPLSTCPQAWSPVAIPDNNANGVTTTLNVPNDGEYVITNVDVWFYITHTYQGDLRVVLTSPAGTNVVLVNRPGSPDCGANGFSADNFGFVDANSFLREFKLDDAATWVYNWPYATCPGTNNVNGSWQPVTALSALNGESKTGPWKLSIQDLAGQDTGTLWVWGMTIRTEPNTPPVSEITAPSDFACTCAGTSILGTASEPDGTFNGYTLDWAAAGAGPWNFVSSGGMPVTNGVLGTLPAGLPEGDVYLRLQVTNRIAMTSTFVKVIRHDAAFASAEIANPTNGQVVGGNVCMDGVRASDNCFVSAELAYAPQGGNFTTFFFTHDPDEAFPPWNTTGLPDGNYTLRVTGTSACGFTASDEVAVAIDNSGGVCQGDFNNDGQFDSLDTQGFVDALLAGQACP